jgi:hypothetical protein
MSALSEDARVGATDAGVVGYQARRQRAANERVNSAATEPDTVEIWCECGRTGCAGHIVTTVADYEKVRRSSTRFFIKEGHEISETERIVDQGEGYVVVEKRGRGGLGEAVALGHRELLPKEERHARDQ